MAVRPSHGWVKQFAARESAALRSAAGDQQGLLSGLNFAVKDMYEVASHANGCGNPTWLATHSAPAQSTAPCVQALLDAGATLLGMAQMDELAYSLNGAPLSQLRLCHCAPCPCDAPAAVPCVFVVDSRPCRAAHRLESSTATTPPMSPAAHCNSRRRREVGSGPGSSGC